MLNHIGKLVRATWRRYLPAMVRRKNGGGSIRTDPHGTMGFMEFGGGEFQKELRHANAAAPSPIARSAQGRRGRILARIVEAAEATRNADSMEDVSDLADEDFIRRMTR